MLKSREREQGRIYRKGLEGEMGEVKDVIIIKSLKVKDIIKEFEN